jgi:hypothetical protein
VKIWQFFEDLNTQLSCSYRYILRIDEDSFIHSPIDYDIFDFMGTNQFVYGYRLCAYEMNYNRLIARWFQQWRQKTQLKRDDFDKDLCGFYNNFFVADLQFFQSRPVQKYLKEIDRQGFIYRKRYGDLMIHSTAVYAFADREQIHRFLDFSYQHVTVDYGEGSLGCVIWGGIQAGYNDRNAEQTLDGFYKTQVLEKKCTANTTYMSEKDLSPTYQHLPDSWRGKVRLKTIISGRVELPNKGILSG